jgi:hypothetical protein
MAVESIYPLDFLSDLLVTKEAVTVSLQRYDETSGTGGGDIWRAQLAPPKWTVEMTFPALSRHQVSRAREIDAKFRALGVNRAFLWADPTYVGPASGVTDVLLATEVMVGSINSDRTSIAFSGLPAGYVMSAGDRLSIVYGASGARSYYMAELTEGVTANSDGDTSEVALYPYLPFGVSAGAEVEIIKPVCKMILNDDGYTPFSYIRGEAPTGAAVSMIQKP